MRRAERKTVRKNLAKRNKASLRAHHLKEGSKRSPERRLNLICPEPAEGKSDSARAQDDAQRPVDLRERSDLKKNPEGV